MEHSVSADHAVLVSIQDSVDDLGRRIAVVAEHYVGSEAEDLASALYEVERNLRSAARRLERITSRLS